ncbi:transcriptional regulator, partial [Morganella morganii]|nr:transcriptional regulator [Morganella morganii]
SWFSVLSGSPRAAILPHAWPDPPDFAPRPGGTGPYQVCCNNDRQLTIRAFDNYDGFRALMDEVSVLVVPELEETMVCTTLHIGADAPERDPLASRMEEG